MTTVTSPANQPVNDSTQSTQIVRIPFSLIGNYGTANSHGDPLNLAIYGVQSNYPPVSVRIFEAPPAGTALSGYTFDYTPGTNPSNGNLYVSQGGTEYTEGSAYSAALLAAVLIAEVILQLGQ